MTDQETNELVLYNSDFQRSVLLLMCSNVSFSINYGLLLKQEYFDSQPLRIIFGIVCDYILKYEKELDRNSMQMMIDDFVLSHGYANEALKALMEESKAIFNSKISSEYFIQDQVLKFIRQSELKYAILKAIAVMEKDTSGSYEEVLRLIDEAVSIGCGVNRGLTFEDLMNLPIEYRNKYNPDKLIRTGFPRFDAAMLGGLAPNEIHIIMGPPKSGKSTFGANIGAHALVGGRAIFHASLEIQELDVLKHYALRLTGMTHDEFMTCDLSTYTNKLERFRKYKPRLFVNYWPEGTINAMAIRSWISRERAQTGINPEIILCDYDDCLVPTSGKTDDMYEDAGMIYRDLIQLSAYFKCCRGNTMVPLLDGRECRIDSFQKGENVYIYSNDNGNIAAERAVALGQTSTTNSIISIELDNGSILELTPNHKIMLNNGQYIEAQYAKIGSSLMPLYRQDDEYGYEMILNNGIYQYTHRMVANQYLSDIVSDQRICVHHKNYNKRNNVPDNLEYMGDLDHFMLHSLMASEVMYNRWHDPNYKDRMREVCVMGAKALYADPKMRKRLIAQSREIMNKLWKDPEFKRKVSERAKIMWQDPGFRKKMISSDKSRAIGSKVFKKLWQDSDFRARKCKSSSIVAKQMWEDPDFVKYMSEVTSSNLVKLWKDPEYRRMQESIHEAQKTDIRFKNIARVKAVNLCKQLISSGVEINKYNYETARLRVSKSGYSTWDNAVAMFGSVDSIIEAARCNHKIVNINQNVVNEEPMYCLYVPTTSNFAVSAGVFIHNCPLISFAQPKRDAWDKPDRNELIVAQDLAHCLIGSTEVLTTGGAVRRVDSYSKGEVAELYGVDAQWNIKPVRAIALGVVDFVNVYINIRLDNGAEVSCTLDHKFSVADFMQGIPDMLGKSYKEAKDFKVGDTITTIDWYAHDRHLAHANVTFTMKVHTKEEPVYCFNVPETGNFVLANGILSSNSAKKAHKAYSISSINFPKGSDRGTLLIDMARRGVSNTRIPIFRDFSRSLVEEV